MLGKGHDPTNYYHDGETINLGLQKVICPTLLIKCSKINGMIIYTWSVRRLGLRNLRTR